MCIISEFLHTKYLRLVTTNVLRMKWLLSFLFLISIGGCISEDEGESCYEKQERICESRFFIPEFPETPDELLKTCREAQTFGNCILDVRETCGEDRNERLIRYVRSGVDYLKSACEEDNPTFKAISSNLQCIKRVSDKDIRICNGDISEENMNIILSHVEPYSESDSDIARCLYRLLDTTCQGLIYGYFCGEEVKDAVIEVSTSFSSGGYSCTKEQLEELEPIYEVFQAIIVEELSLVEAIKKRRK